MSGIDFLPLFVFGAPLIALLVAAVFRMDEIAARPNDRKAHRVPRVDELGRPVCQDPDGRCYSRAGKIISAADQA
jgi:hypothetical protein